MTSPPFIIPPGPGYIKLTGRVHWDDHGQALCAPGKRKRNPRLTRTRSQITCKNCKTIVERWR